MNSAFKLLLFLLIHTTVFTMMVSKKIIDAHSEF